MATHKTFGGRNFEAHSGDKMKQDNFIKADLFSYIKWREKASLKSMGQFLIV